MNIDIEKVKAITMHVVSICSGFIQINLVFPIILVNIFNQLIDSFRQRNISSVLSFKLF